MINIYCDKQWESLRIVLGCLIQREMRRVVVIDVHADICCCVRGSRVGACMNEIV